MIKKSKLIIIFLTVLFLSFVIGEGIKSELDISADIVDLILWISVTLFITGVVLYYRYDRNKRLSKLSEKERQDIREALLVKKSRVLKIIKFAFWFGLIIGAIWLIIGLIVTIGPLWIIAIILLLIFFAVANR